MKTLWIDVETTGLIAENNFIIELAALYENNGMDKSIFHVYILPEKRPDDFDFIEELTGITWEYLEQNGISESQAYTEFTTWLAYRMDKFDSEDKAIFAAYNARFDYDFMREFFKHNSDKYFGSWFFKIPMDIMNTVMLCVRLELIPILPDFKNATVIKFFEIEYQAHSAIEDIKASRQIQLKMEGLLRGTK
jgi:DNA polymerase III alpha subunit (gram-positive type)